MQKMNERLNESCQRLRGSGIVDEDLLPECIDMMAPMPDPELIVRLERANKHAQIYEVVRDARTGEKLQEIIVPARLAR